MSDRSFCRSLQKSEWAVVPFLLFSKEQQKEWSFFALSKRSTKRAMAHLLFQKEQKRKIEQSLIFKLSKWPTLAAGLGNRSFAHLLMVHFRSFQMSDWSIARSFALCKRANEQSLFALFKRATKREIALLLFQKERSLFCSFKKSERAKMSKKWAIFQIAHFLLKKRAIAHFQNERMPNPVNDASSLLFYHFHYSET